MDENPQSSVLVTEGRILYNVVREAFRTAKYTLSPKNNKAVLVWNDTIKDSDYFSMLRPWQVVNRLPSINIICRKTPFVRLINRIQPLFPQLYSFLPRSFILPLQNTEFIQLVAKHDKKYIIKPDNGSLGSGITILNKDMSFSPTSYLSVAQEYVESCLVDQTKFDCRIYVLVASISPLRVYVYRGGVARFCSQQSDGSNSIYCQLTNTAVNKHNPNVATIEAITKMVPEVFEQLRSKNGVDVDLLWKKIDHVAVLTIISALGYLQQGEARSKCNCGYSRCFQILGFDILIDQKYDPVILEVNYRPSLETDTDAERKMKCEMLSEAMKIAAPLNEIQKFVSATKVNYNENGWRNFMFANPSLVDEINKQHDINLKSSHFVQAYPNKDPSCQVWEDVIEKVKSMPTGIEDRFKLPTDVQYNTLNTASEHLPPINSNQQPQKTVEKTYLSHQTKNNNKQGQQNQTTIISKSNSILSSNANLISNSNSLVNDIDADLNENPYIPRQETPGTLKGLLTSAKNRRSVTKPVVQQKNVFQNH